MLWCRYGAGPPDYEQAGPAGIPQEDPLGQRAPSDRAGGADPHLRHPHVLRHLQAAGQHQTSRRGARAPGQDTQHVQPTRDTLLQQGPLVRLLSNTPFSILFSIPESSSNLRYFATTCLKFLYF